MNPGNVLAGIARLPSQAVTHEAEQGVENTASIRTHRHRRSEFYFSGMGNNHFVERPLPGGRDADAEAPRFGHARFRAAQDAGKLVIRSIETMRVNGGSAGLQPDPRRPLRFCDGLAYRPRRLNTRFLDEAPVLRMVAAINRTSCEIND